MGKRKRQNVAVSETMAESGTTVKKTKAAGDAPVQKPKSTRTATTTTAMTATETKTKPKTKKTATTTSTTTTTAKTPAFTGPAATEKLSTKAVSAAPKTLSTTTGPAAPEILQIITGSYDRVLHGFTATISTRGELEFTDTFLFNAHASAIRCVAVSPPSAPAAKQTQKVLLASGSTDERIQVYNLSAHPPSRRNQKLSANVAPRPVLENARNRELGTLLHHESTINALSFPSRSKLLSASDDSSVAVARTRDWSVLSAIRAPKPKALGRPSGDTAAYGGAPSGVNDFAVHPSMKLMISVSKGERCMRLWNLVTGKKAGVLGFSREMLAEVGEGRYATGEARRVVWGSADGADEFAVGFDKGLVVFGMDSVPKCRVLGGRAAKGKVHQFGYLTVDEEAGLSVLGVATEDGRIAFFSTRAEDLITSPEAEASKEEKGKKEGAEEEDVGEDVQEGKKKGRKDEERTSLPVAKCLGEVGGRASGVTGRIKDFVLLKSPGSPDVVYAVGGSSDGRVRIWTLSVEDLRRRILGKEKKEKEGEKGEKGKKEETAVKSGEGVSMGKLAGMYETHNRITCMAGFVMLPRPEGVEDSEDEDENEDEEGEGESVDEDEDEDEDEED